MGKQQRSEDTRQSLIASGSRVFASTPFDKARIADVLEPLRLTQGAFYFHFANKHELALAVIRREHELMVKMSETILTEAQDGLSGLRDVALRLAQLVRTDITVQAGLRLTSHTPEEFPEFLGASFEIWNSTISKFLWKAQEQGDVRLDVDIVVAAHYIVATFMGVQEISAIATQWDDFEDRIRDVSTLAIRAIATDHGYRSFLARHDQSALA